MENASKALLIAGAILVCIVLISVGMLIVNSTSEVTDQVGDLTSSQAAQTFNNQFSKYVGKQKGSTVKALMESIATNNNISENDIKLTVVSGGTTLCTDATDGTTIMSKMSSIKNASTYTVDITAQDTTSGYITSMKIAN